VKPRKRRVAILGGGMAGMVAAWRLSEPRWRDEVESITVYQRGWRLGGKGASSRGVNGRIEEHGLHLWLGYYENAFRVLRECYEELDRPATDPSARILTWRDAMIPTPDVGLEDLGAGGWRHWIGRFTTNDELPGEPDAPVTASAVDFVRRALRLVADFLESLADPSALRPGPLVLSDSRTPPDAPIRQSPLVAGLPVAVLAGVLEALARLHEIAAWPRFDGAVDALDRSLEGIRAALLDTAAGDPDVRRTWHLVSVMSASVRGVLADELLTRGFRAVNDEDFLDWIIRHGAAPEVADFAFIRGLYDLVFADRGPERATRGVSAGTAVFMTSKMFFEYKGAIFWKMTAGMGDVVFAPLYEAMRRRGVEFEFFHRVVDLHVSDDGLAIETISLARQVDLADGCDRYDPLVRVGGLPAFPDAPLAEQLSGVDGSEVGDLESHWCEHPDAGRRLLRRGQDFDDVVLAIPVAMSAIVCRELVEQRREWQSMVEHLSTTATQAFQMWVREDEPSLGWPHPGSTVSAYEQPFNTWASMDQLVEAECWPDRDRPATIAYFCGALDAPWPAIDDSDSYPSQWRQRVVANVLRFLECEAGHLLPRLGGPGGMQWGLLCGSDGRRDETALETQFVTANVDPSDRYVQCVPGSDQFRLRSDESGFDNLFLAGDWTDNGLNAGCIEAATLSGLQAANAVLGHSRNFGIRGFYLD
jgi:uncharacterized protein with NAD-binding domain and iron-sulfur cluster